MAPRKRQTRMDAAFDNLVPLGFTKKVIRSKVNKLLKVYGKDSGWPFIEEASYRLLIECILEEQENELLKIESREVDEGDLVTGEPSDAGISNQVDTFNEPTSGEPETKLVKERLEDNNCILPAAEESVQQKVNVIVSVKKEGDLVSVACTPDRGAGETENIGVNTPVVSTPAYRRRKPCFGFIGSDDSAEGDFVYPVTRASLQCQMTHNCSTSGSSSRKDRKSRWDVKPEHV